MANNKVTLRDGTVIIDLTDSTITPEDLMQGIVAYNKAGERIVGTMAQLIIDIAMSDTSENVVQNRVIKAYVDNAITDAIRGGVPTDYIRLDYIQGDGNAYIDTGLTLDGSLSFYIETGGVPSGKIGAIITAHNSGTAENGRQGFMIFNTASHKTDFYWAGVSYTNLTVDSNIDLASKVRVTQDKNGITVEQGTYSSSVSYDGTDAVNTAHVLLLKSENPNHGAYTYGRLYKVVISKDGEQIRKLMPVKRKSDDAVGMYDVIGKLFYENSGSGAFIPGFEID